MKMRLIGAAILIVVLVPLLLLGGIPFEIGIAVISALSFRELLILFKNKNKIPLIMEIFSYIAVVVLTLSLDSILQALALIIMIFFIPLIIFKNKEYTFNSVTSLLGIIVFIGVIYHGIINVRISSIWEMLYLLSITILTDTFAYLGGKLFGRIKLIERISPNKTIEGSLTGLIVATSISSVFYLYIINPSVNVGIIILISFVLSIIGQIGDLVFSAIKRDFEIKDFSNIIPGHGGLLDRFDSIAFVSLFYIVIKLLFL
jgi:phosphatidate cytidylyltransferase